MEKQLHIKRGSRTLNIRGYTRLKKKYVVINCMEYWESDDEDLGEDEEENAYFYLKPEDIDPIIEKLKEAKEFLNETS